MPPAPGASPAEPRASLDLTSNNWPHLFDPPKQSFCPQPRNGTVRFSTPQHTLLWRPPCSRWDCPHCGSRHTSRLRCRMEQLTPNRFLTLTWSPTTSPCAADAWKPFSIAINRLMKRLRRHNPTQPIGYCLVWETTKAGYPHAHILMSSPFIPQKVIRRHWKQLTGASIVDIRRIRSPRGVTTYLAKYLTKANTVPSGMKHYRSSRHYLPPLPKVSITILDIPVETGYEPRAIHHVTSAYLRAGAILLSPPSDTIMLLTSPPHH